MSNASILGLFYTWLALGHLARFCYKFDEQQQGKRVVGNLMPQRMSRHALFYLIKKCTFLYFRLLFNFHN